MIDCSLFCPFKLVLIQTFNVYYTVYDSDHHSRILIGPKLIRSILFGIIAIISLVS
jgi:hypothetical protein